jgi:hypothetical protein
MDDVNQSIGSEQMGLDDNCDDSDSYNNSNKHEVVRVTSIVQKDRKVRYQKYSANRSKVSKRVHEAQRGRPKNFLNRPRPSLIQPLSISVSVLTFSNPPFLNPPGSEHQSRSITTWKYGRLAEAANCWEAIVFWVLTKSSQYDWLENLHALCLCDCANSKWLRRTQSQNCPI